MKFNVNSNKVAYLGVFFGAANSVVSQNLIQR